MKEKKPPSRRTNAKEYVETIAALFAPLNITSFAFGKFKYPITIQSISLAKLGDMKNAPEKRKDENGKMYTPLVMQFVTDAGYLYFIIEDIDIVAITNGLRISTAAITVDFRESS